MSLFDIRTAGDPVLRTKTEEVKEITEDLQKLSQNMFEAMYEAEGIGLAAPQIGVSKRIFVYDLKPETRSAQGVIINPVIEESEGEWSFQEGCLSIPGWSWDILRPKKINVKGTNMEGGQIEVEADTLFSRLIQHELDHLNGVLMFDRLEPDEKRKAMADLRKSFGKARL